MIEVLKNSNYKIIGWIINSKKQVLIIIDWLGRKFEHDDKTLHNTLSPVTVSQTRTLQDYLNKISYKSSNAKENLSNYMPNDIQKKKN